LLANPYQTAIANAVQRIDDGKNKFGLGKNETNMLAVLIDLEIQLGNELIAVANGRSGLRSPLTIAETGKT
jgi:hypothetical protein